MSVNPRSHDVTHCRRNPIPHCARNCSCFNESLALRVNAQGEYEVVLRGISDICGQHFGGLSTATVGIGSIAIHTLVSGSGGGCGPEAPSFSPYEIAVPVGALAPGSYSVVWTIVVALPAAQRQRFWWPPSSRNRCALSQSLRSRTARWLSWLSCYSLRHKRLRRGPIKVGKTSRKLKQPPGSTNRHGQYCDDLPDFSGSRCPSPYLRDRGHANGASTEKVRQSSVLHARSVT